MKVLLTGGTGLVGSALAKKLIQNGDHIYVVSRNPSEARRQVGFPCDHISWSDVNAGKVPIVDAVVHLAGEPIASRFWTERQKKRIIGSRVESIKSLQAAFEAVGAWPKVWVNASAIGFYGDRGDELLTESSASGQGFLAKTCQAWEDATLLVQSKTRLVRVRIGLVFAKRGGMMAALLPAFRAGIAGVLGGGKQWMSWIHLDDLVGIIEFSLRQDKVQGTFNAVAPEPVTNRTFTEQLAEALKRPALLPVPRFLLELIGEMSALVLASQRVSSEKIQNAGYAFKFKNIKDAFQNLFDFEYRWGVHELYQEQWLPKNTEELFPFFCDERNLEVLTPPILNFKVLSKSTDTIQEGTLIDYRLKIRGVPAKWRTQILEWNPGKSFVDTQLKGPYKLWHHTHEFHQLGNGTLMIDRVLFKLPVWPLGMVLYPFIRSDVNGIFKFRRSEIEKRFGQS